MENRTPLYPPVSSRKSHLARSRNTAAFLRKKSRTALPPEVTVRVDSWKPPATAAFLILDFIQIVRVLGGSAFLIINTIAAGDFSKATRRKVAALREKKAATVDPFCNKLSFHANAKRAATSVIGLSRAVRVYVSVARPYFSDVSWRRWYGRRDFEVLKSKTVPREKKLSPWTGLFNSRLMNRVNRMEKGSVIPSEVFWLVI